MPVREALIEGSDPFGVDIALNGRYRVWVGILALEGVGYFPEPSDKGKSLFEWY